MCPAIFHEIPLSLEEEELKDYNRFWGGLICLLETENWISALWQETEILLEKVFYKLLSSKIPFLPLIFK